MSTSHAYDAAGQTLGVTTSDQAGVDLLELAYTYTDAGLVDDQTTTRSLTARAPPTTASTSQTFTFDPLGRIAEIVGHLAGSFTFDDADRITALADGRTLTYDSAGQVSTLTTPATGATSSFGYDARGNRTSTATTTGTTTTSSTATFDAANRLTTLTAPSGATTTYTYDAGGLRTSAVTTDGSATSTEAFAWDTQAAVPLLLTDATHAYVYGAGSAPIAQVRLVEQATQYLHGDALGSIRSVTDATGQVVCDADYDAYGAPLAVTADACAPVTRFGYAGGYTDPTGLIYLRARYCDRATAQFLSVDPLVDTTRNP